MVKIVNMESNKDIYILKVDYRGTKFSSPESIGLAVYSKKEADRFVQESIKGEKRSYEKVSVFNNYEFGEAYQEQLRDAEVNILPSKRKSGEKSGIYRNRETGRFRNTPSNNHKMYHMYLLSKEEICDGDYVYGWDEIIKWNSQEQNTISPTGYKKIVASTDRSLGLPLIGWEFTNEYIINGGRIKEVEYKVVKVLKGYRGLIDVAVIYKK